MVLDTLKSKKGFYVKQKQYDKKLYLQYICAKENKITAELFATRKVKYKDKDDYLNPKLRNLLPKMDKLKDIDKAVECIIQSIKDNDKICIFGDYDVDGTTSTAMFILFFEILGIKTNYYIPDRIKEGYGPNNNAIEKIAKSGVKLLICVDCGATAIEQLEKATQLGLKVIVIDHHKTDEILPKCIACVNPNRFDENLIQEDLHCLCACAVSFFVLLELSKELKKQNKIIDLMQFIPLVAFATICDVMTLTILNRAFIKTGISILNKNKSFNLYELLNCYNKDKKNKIQQITAYTFGFLLGPMVNAGGRIGNSSLGVELIIEKQQPTANVIAEKLYQLNEERKLIETDILNSLITRKNEMQQQIAEQGFIILYSNEWHEGVIGLIASRIKDKYFCPVFAGSVDDNGIIKFSSRSIDSVDIGKIILQAKEKDLLLNGGGHKLAGGLTCELNKLEKFKSFLKENIKSLSIEFLEKKTIEYDIALSLGGLNIDLLENVKKFEPFGVGNLKPIFLIQNVVIIQINVINDKHVALILSDNGITSRAICFNCVDTDFGKSLISSKGKTLSILATADISEFQGSRRIDIKIEDFII